MQSWLKIKNTAWIFLILIAFLFLNVFFIWFYEDCLEFKYYVSYYLSSQYQKDRNLIAPYFDEQFYLQHYGAAVKKSGLKPIDHFLRKGWYSSNWWLHTDPNAWFNTTLYQQRLWGHQQGNPSLVDDLIDLFQTKTNPLVDFLQQPKLKPHSQTIEVWANKDELNRAWLAVEGLMRLDRFNVSLHLTNNAAKNGLICFAPQVKRGLKLLVDNHQHRSFYHSDFIRNPDKYQLISLPPKKEAFWEDPVTYIKNGDFAYLLHQLYVYIHWVKKGKINPTIINIAKYCGEPFYYSPFIGSFNQKLTLIMKSLGSNKSLSFHQLRAQNFQNYLIRISDGFDLCLFDAKLPIHNLKIIPGNMRIWIDTKELSPHKEFSVSFLLTHKKKKQEIFNYSLRHEFWQKERELRIPTRFYISFRGRDFFPKKLQPRVMPTDSKKWILNSQFSIIIENTNLEYYFTEKILDCFAALTVPIYLGCPNVTDYFDPRGMIIVQSPDEIITAVNSLTPKTYQSMLPYLKENKRRALKLLTLEKDTITEFAKRKLGVKQ